MLGRLSLGYSPPRNNKRVLGADISRLDSSNSRYYILYEYSVRYIVVAVRRRGSERGGNVRRVDSLNRSAYSIFIRGVRNLSSLYYLRRESRDYVDISLVT